MIRILLIILSINIVLLGEDNFEDKIKHVNKELSELKVDLSKKYNEAAVLFAQKKDSADYSDILSNINEIKFKILNLQEQCKSDFLQESEESEEGYAFWDQGETTLSQLVMEYGASDYLYIIPHELSSLKINVFSSIPIPHQLWGDLLESILSHNGIGVKKSGPYLRQLYIFKHDPTAIESIASSEEDLKLIKDNSRVFYVFEPPVESIKGIQGFFERFSDPKQISIQVVGSKIILVAPKECITKLLNLYKAAWGQEQNKIIKVINLVKIKSQEAEQILKGFFLESSLNRNRPAFYQSGLEDLLVYQMPHGNALAVIGTESQVQKASRIIEDLENQIEDASEMTVFWYTCKHSDPEDIAAVLEKVYSFLGTSELDGKLKDLQNTSKSTTNSPVTVSKNVREDRDTSSAYHPVNPVNPPFIQPGVIHKDANAKSYGNFVVDPKTGSVLIVARKEELPKIKSLLKKLDVPKKMVQIEVLLVEKKLRDRKQTGINLFRIGSTASGKSEAGISFDTDINAKNKGILDFIFKRPKGDLPAIDLTMSLLMAQEDVSINATPSVMAINQTPATIAITEEMSINNGAIKLDTTGGVTVEKSYTRAQFGITIVMTPTIHLPDDDDENSKGFITLQTDVNFDTTKASGDQDRPLVERRKVANEVRVADGETIILGGLKRRSGEDMREKMPFLGDIPGVGKLFGTTKLSDSTTEMFIFITPRIVQDPIGDNKDFREEILKKRPGDIPEFLQILEDSRKEEKKKVLKNSLDLIFDKL